MCVIYSLLYWTSLISLNTYKIWWIAIFAHFNEWSGFARAFVCARAMAPTLFYSSHCHFQFGISIVYTFECIKTFINTNTWFERENPCRVMFTQQKDGVNCVGVCAFMQKCSHSPDALTVDDLHVFWNLLHFFLDEAHGKIRQNSGNDIMKQIAFTRDFHNFCFRLCIVSMRVLLVEFVVSSFFFRFCCHNDCYFSLINTTKCERILLCAHSQWFICDRFKLFVR